MADVKPNPNQPTPPFPPGPFEIIYADPPWDYKGQLQHAGPGSGDTGGARHHYSTVTSKQLGQWPVNNIASDDALLFMWTTNPHLPQALALGDAWGFAYATVGFVWDKESTNPGFYTLSGCELCLIFKKGRIPRPRGARNVRQLIREKRSRHSTKPAEARHRIELMFPEQSKIELFAREPAPGWTVWGAEAP